MAKVKCTDDYSSNLERIIKENKGCPIYHMDSAMGTDQAAKIAVIGAGADQAVIKRLIDAGYRIIGAGHMDYKVILQDAGGNQHDLEEILSRDNLEARIALLKGPGQKRPKKKEKPLKRLFAKNKTVQDLKLENPKSKYHK